MKFLVVLAVVVVACAAADVTNFVKSDDYSAPVVKSTYESSPDNNNFQYSYETGNGIFAQAEGVVKNPNTDQATLEIRGSSKYYAPDGTPIETTYVANEQGYVATGSHIPTVPEAILRALAWTEAHRPPVEKVFKP